MTPTTVKTSIWPSTPSWLKGVSSGRDNFLSAVPPSLHETTCRCSMQKFQGWYFNETRKMWVCGTCHKPSPVHQGYNVVCLFGCGEDFTVWKFGASDADPSEVWEQAIKDARNSLCMDCGGDNDARLYA